MGAALSNLACQAVGYLYGSYLCYKVLKTQTAPSEQVKMVSNVVMGVGFVALTERFTDRVLGWVPLYYAAKVAATVWLVHPAYGGGECVLKSQVHPALGEALSRMSGR